MPAHAPFFLLQALFIHPDKKIALSLLEIAVKGNHVTWKSKAIRSTEKIDIPGITVGVGNQ
jgi:hypothetical protein